MGLSCRSTMHNTVKRCITYQSGYLSTPAILLQPTSSPHMPNYTSWTESVENPEQWRDGLCHEWLTLYNLHLSWLVSTGVSLLLDHYFQDQIRQMIMWQLDVTIPPNLSDPLLPVFLFLFLFTCWVAGKTMEEQIREKNNYTCSLPRFERHLVEVSGLCMKPFHSFWRTTNT